MSMREQTERVQHGLLLMATGKGYMAHLLRTAALYIVVYAVVTAVVRMLLGPGWSLTAGIIGLSLINPVVKWAARTRTSQPTDDAEENT